MTKTIYTLGLDGSTPDDVLQFVKATGGLLVDVRANPRRADAQWTAFALERLVGWDNYLPCRALSMRKVSRKKVVVEELVEPMMAAKYLWDVTKTRNIILVCDCADLKTCHRKIASDYLKATWAPLMEDKPKVVHLPGEFARWKEAA